MALLFSVKGGSQKQFSYPSMDQNVHLPGPFPPLLNSINVVFTSQSRVAKASLSRLLMFSNSHIMKTSLFLMFQFCLMLR